MPELHIAAACGKCVQILALLILLVTYEVVFFIAFVSVSIGVGLGAKLMLRSSFGLLLNIVSETVVTWWCLASFAQLHLFLYRRYLFPSVREHIKRHRSVLQGIPRIIYFILYCTAIYGLCHEYKAIHNYRPTNVRQPSSVAMTVGRNNSKHHRRVHHYWRMPVYADEDFAPEAPEEKLHTALFLTMMSYLIYASSNVLGNFLMRISNSIPVLPFLPQLYAMTTMSVMQFIMTVFYSFPLLMTLIACHIFRVEGASTYMFALCLALSIAMAAAQLESENPFPTQARLGPYYFYENQHRARVNVVMICLPPIAYFYFNKAKSYPLTAGDLNFTHFTFWIMIALLHIIKSMYLTTWRPMRPIHVDRDHNRHPPAVVEGLVDFPPILEDALPAPPQPRRDPALENPSMGNNNEGDSNGNHKLTGASVTSNTEVNTLEEQAQAQVSREKMEERGKSSQRIFPRKKPGSEEEEDIPENEDPPGNDKSCELEENDNNEAENLAKEAPKTIFSVTIVDEVNKVTVQPPGGFLETTETDKKAVSEGQTSNIEICTETQVTGSDSSIKSRQKDGPI